MARLNGQYFRTYRLLAGISAVYWGLLALISALGLGPAGMAPSRIAGSLALGGFLLAMRLEKDPASPRVERWGLALAGVSIINCSLLVVARPDAFLMVNFLMLTLVIGVGFRDRAHCLTALAMNLVAVGMLSPLLPPERRWTILLGAGFTAWVAFLLHRLFSTLFHRLEAMDRKRALLARQRSRLVRDLRRALAEVKTLGGLIPICAGCKSVRNDQGYWEGVESYLERTTDAGFTHGYCPACEGDLREAFEAAVPLEEAEPLG